jgi:tRNA (cytidine/uridine-2'-O-)-methyltransferase
MMRRHTTFQLTLVEAEAKPMKIALYQPDIPQNTGTMLRMCACLGVQAHVIGPAGFDFSDRALRRAGLDYLAHVDLARHASWSDYLAERSAKTDGGRLVLLTTHAELRYTDFRFAAADTLLLGRESAGVPDDVHATADARIRIPVRTGLRSLNVAVAAAIVTGEALRQTGAL